MHSIYIIYSKKIDKYYIGETSNLEIRLKQHNNHYFKSNFTKAASDWKMVLSYQCETKKQAIFLEKFIKKMKSRKFIEKIILSPQILSSILNDK